jgi:hypothetical protein
MVFFISHTVKSAQNNLRQRLDAVAANNLQYDSLGGQFIVANTQLT